MKKTIHRAKYVLADPRTLLKNSAIETTEEGRIANIAPWREIACPPESKTVDWGAAILIPGLVNAHIHMELTSLRDVIPRSLPFTDWLSRLIAERRSWNPEQLQGSIRQGVLESLASGTTLVGDISSSGATRDFTRDIPLRQVVFEESIAFSPELSAERVSDMDRILDPSEASDFYRRGISPHAPYSVSRDLYRGLAKLAQQRNLHLATHIAETEEEIQFLQTGAGEFRNFLESMDLFPSDWNPPRLDPIPYIHSLGVLSANSILVHCNYLDRESIRLIADSHSSVVYCPRSHAFFHHRRHPIRALLDAGINVALGTDSLASNRTLSLLDEIRFLYAERKDLEAEEILQAATFNGARALGFGSRLGILKSGYWADMTVLEIPSEMEISKAPDQILEGAGECVGTIVGGRIAWKKGDPAASFQ